MVSNRCDLPVPRYPFIGSMPGAFFSSLALISFIVVLMAFVGKVWSKNHAGSPSNPPKRGSLFGPGGAKPLHPITGFRSLLNSLGSLTEEISRRNPIIERRLATKKSPSLDMIE